MSVFLGWNGGHSSMQRSAGWLDCNSMRCIDISGTPDFLSLIKACAYG
jgi:hypothetical protein